MRSRFRVHLDLPDAERRAMESVAWPLTQQFDVSAVEPGRRS